MGTQVSRWIRGGAMLLGGAVIGLLASAAIGRWPQHEDARDTAATKHKSREHPTVERSAEEMLNEGLIRFNSESRNRDWAETSEARLRAEIGEMAASNKFELVDVECRQKSCLMRTKWPSLEDGLQRAAMIPQRSISVRCSITSFPPDRDGRAITLFENCLPS